MAIRVAIHHQDAYLAMKAFLPPKQKRGIVLIDPPFEKTNEFEQIIFSLKIALQHWRAGCFMIWYPIKNQTAVNHFCDNIQSLTMAHLIIRFELNEIMEPGKLSSCGLLMINPPWQLKETLEDSILPYLADTLDAHGDITLVESER